MMIEVTALGTINGTIAAPKAMRGPAGDRGGGHVVNIVWLGGLTAVAASCCNPKTWSTQSARCSTSPG